uniref:Secreted protein n=1 Tax=Rhizophora mucronata TaxID=61149 RepID=A0A2P2NTU6_RHIMU
MCQMSVFVMRAAFLLCLYSGSAIANRLMELDFSLIPSGNILKWARSSKVLMDCHFTSTGVSCLLYLPCLFCLPKPQPLCICFL